jgi:hypothetical protein
MEAAPLNEEWDILASLLPAEWRSLARDTGAMRRARGAIDSPETLLRVLLLHVATGLSLRQTVARAQVQGIATLSDVALLKRLRTSGDWLRELSRRMFESSRYIDGKVSAPPGRRLRAIDATTIQQPGSVGTDWRVHYCITLPEMRCDFFELTDASGSESYKRVPVESGDIILADRGYAHRKGVAHIVREGGDAVVRWNSSAFPLLAAEHGKTFDMLAMLRALPGHEPGDLPARYEADGATFHARVCAVRKSEVAIEIAKKKLRSDASRRGTKLRDATLEFAEYVIVITTLDAQTLDAREVLGLYRARWQIELCFKRFKSLLQLGDLPKRSDASSRAWVQGKLLTVLLIERLIDEAELFSPWGFDLVAAQPLA